MWIYRFRPVYILLILILISIVFSGQTTYLQQNNGSDSVEVYFMPIDADKAITRIVSLINNAKNYIYLAVFILDEKRIVEALIDATHRGVDVRVVSDSETTPQTIVSNLRDNGIRVVLDERPGDYMHDKFIVIDDEYVVTGSTNFRDRSFYKNNNDVVIIHDRGVALDYKAEFLEMYNHVFGGGEPTKNPINRFDNTVIEVYFSPDDSVAKRIIRYIYKANKSILFATFTFTNSKIANALAEKAHNITVVGVVEEYQFKSIRSMEYVVDLLRKNGAKIYTDINPYTMHCKLFIIDGEIVITGSYNPTIHAEYSNDENMVIIHSKDIARRYTWYYKNYLMPNGTRIIVKITDGNGDPLRDVKIYAEDLSTNTRYFNKTNNSGIAIIYYNDLRPDRKVRITISPEGFLETSKSVIVDVKLGPNLIEITINKHNNRLIVFIIGVVTVVLIALLYDRVLARIKHKH